MSIDDTSTPERPTHGGHDHGTGHHGGHGQRRRRGVPSGLVTRVAGDALSVRRAFGEPVQQDGITLVPVARVMGGTGSGYGTGEFAGTPAAARQGEGTGSGGGGGFGIRVTPVGVYVIEGSTVRWQPAFDLNRVIRGGQITGAIAILALSVALRRRGRGRRR